MHKLKELVGEGWFLIRSLFFMVFGYLIDIVEIFNPATLVRAFGIVVGAFLIRSICLYFLYRFFPFTISW